MFSFGKSFKYYSNKDSFDLLLSVQKVIDDQHGH